MIATGGGDTGVLLRAVDQESLDGGPAVESSVWLKQQSPSGASIASAPWDQTDAHETRDDFPRTMALVSLGAAVACSDAGAVYRCDLATKEMTQLFQDDEYRAYSVLACNHDNRCSGLVAVGGVHGYVTVALAGAEDGFPAPVRWKAHDAKVVFLCWPDGSTGPDGCGDLIVSAQPNWVSWWRISCQSPRLTQTLMARYELPGAQWVQCATFLPDATVSAHR